MDRNLDLFSPLVTPLTYEGLISEVCPGGITPDQTIHYPSTTTATTSSTTTTLSGTQSTAAAASSSSTTTTLVSMVLSEEDAIYAELRHLPIERIGERLRIKSVEIKEIYAQFKGQKNASTISDIHTFMYQKMPQLQASYQSLNQHLNLAAYVSTSTGSKAFRSCWTVERSLLEGDYSSGYSQLEDIICADIEGQRLNTVLRLICLYSLCGGGIRSARYDALRRLVTQVYGFGRLVAWNSLEKRGTCPSITVYLEVRWTYI